MTGQGLSKVQAWSYFRCQVLFCRIYEINIYRGEETHVFNTLVSPGIPLSCHQVFIEGISTLQY